MKSLSPKTFKNKKAALEYSRRIEGNNELAIAMGDPVTNGLLLTTLIQDYLGQHTGKDKNVFYRLAMPDLQHEKL